MKRQTFFSTGTIVLLGMMLYPEQSSAQRVGDCPVFPSDNPWNVDVSAYPVHPMSSVFVAH